MAEALGTDPVEALPLRLGHVFDDPGLLLLALTHRSWCAEHPGTQSNERLEFLGDAVLGLVVTDHVFRCYPDMPEGSLAKLRAAVVSAPTLAEVGADLGLGAALRLSRGEESIGGRTKRSILCDALEAVIGAVYLDGGLDAARRLVIELLADRIAAEAADGPGGTDHKSQLQALAARLYDGAPVYRVSEEGPDHDKRFSAEVLLDGRVVGAGEGRSKKLAEQAAAGAALDHIAATAASTTTSESEQGHA